MASIFLFYWVDKYLVLRRYARPTNLSADLSNAVIEFFLELSITIFSVKLFYSAEFLVKNMWTTIYPNLFLIRDYTI
jgi:hypothetical protein